MDGFPFGRPSDAIFQMAYYVPDIEAGMEWWTAQFGVGPWFVIDRIGGSGVTYRGRPANAEFRIALGYSGYLNIELVQTLDDRPSIYKEAREKRGYGFHHVAKAVPNLQESVAAHRALGCTVLHHSPTPGGGQVYILDGGGDGPGMIELVEDVPATREIFTAIRQASVGWDGGNPRRDFAEALTGLATVD
ncbi:VOC family protein [Streptomyces shenzhenensis]|uniref:VOC family protein n=1 Tax=Streptomyces shenzhenensis TaxID=943815 RepID=UPI0015F102E3|nr:VOC family protein [Streptomyces shenzhenensis]